MERGWREASAAAREDQREGGRGAEEVSRRRTGVEESGLRTERWGKVGGRGRGGGVRRGGMRGLWRLGEDAMTARFQRGGSGGSRVEG